MKKIVVFFTALALCMTVSAEKNITIQLTDLPQAAQTFISTYFPNEKASNVILQREIGKTCYQVSFASGSKIKFNGKGMWREVNCGNSPLPQGLVPAPIVAFVNGWNPNATINEIELDRGHTDITLSTGTEMEFNKNMTVIDIEQ